MMFYIIQTVVITLMFYSFTKNHYIVPLNSCLMAKICNHTGIEICGLENDHQDMRLFLDDCDMLEYNCDYKKVYIKADDKVCKEIKMETTSENSTISTSVMEESTAVNYSSQTTTNHTTSPTSLQTITQTQPEPEIITIPSQSMTSVSGTPTAKCTCMDLETIPMSNTESAINSTLAKHECPCTDSHSKSSPIRTLIDKTSETTSIASVTTSVLRASETTNITEQTIESTYVNITRIPIATECTRGEHNSTSIKASEKQITDSVNKSSETTYKSTDTSSSVLETHTPTTPIHLETEESTTSSIDNTTQITSATVSTLAETQKGCTCKSTNVERNETIPTQTKNVSEIITILTKPMTPVSGTTTAKLQTTPVSNSESTITLSQSKHECICTSITYDKTTQTPLKENDSPEITATTVEYEDVDTTSKHTSCDKYPKHCERPQTWETTARDETRDFFQILRERFGDRVKILKDTTHWPRRMTKAMEHENDAFNFGAHNET